MEYLVNMTTRVPAGMSPRESWASGGRPVVRTCR
jgi:hypothetical protein